MARRIYLLILAGLICFLTASAAHASYYESCEVKAELVKVLPTKESEKNAKLKILVKEVTALPGSHGDCSALVGKEHEIEIAELSKKARATLKEGKSIVLSYTFINSNGAAGVVSNTVTWRYGEPSPLFR